MGPNRMPLIVIEGTDGSGKATQAALLTERLLGLGLPAATVSFPRYGHPMAAGVERYLQGLYGTDPETVSAYAASALYAVDRFDAAYGPDSPLADPGKIVIADRYTTSNALHQTEKLLPERRHAFLDWLYDLEYAKLGCPRPDLVLFLYVDPETSLALLKARRGKPGVKNDIHEQDADYLKRVLESASDTAGYSDWTTIPCSAGKRMLPVERIHERIFAETSKLLTQRGILPCP